MPITASDIKDKVLEFARFSASDAIKGKIALRWASDPSAMKLPENLRNQEASMLILNLPRVLDENGLKLAASFMKAWLFGQGLIQERFVKFGRYFLFDVGRLSTSKTVLSAFADAKQSSLETIANEGAEGFSNPRWIKFRQTIGDFDERQKRAKKDTWVYEDVIWKQFEVAPQWYFGMDEIGHLSYAASREIGRSDAFASLARFTINKYISTRVEKRSDGQIYVIPKLLGMRVQDQYDFIDDFGLKDVVPGLFLSGRPSQPLGFYKSAESGSVISLTNEDFRTFKQGFAQSYNNLASTRDKLTCEYFSVYSEMRTSKIAGGSYRLSA